MKPLILVLLLALVAMPACANHRRKEAYDALASLRKIQAATEVGVAYPQYHSLLIDAQAQVNNAEAALPDGSVKTELRLTVDSYIDAGTVWQEKLRDDNYYLTSNVEPGKTLIKKYPLATFKMQNHIGANPDKALHAIWFHANLRLAKLAELLPTK